MKIQLVHKYNDIISCDTRKFFANIDHQILLNILGEYIPDKDIMWLLGNVVDSFETVSVASDGNHPRPSLERRGYGLPLGNLTSALLVMAIQPNYASR